jgi:site-specific DNA-cytosine methylase
VVASPCQPFSHAGLKRFDTRGTPLFDVVDILNRKAEVDNPEVSCWFSLKNVKGLRGHDSEIH